MQKLRIVTVGFGTARQKLALERRNKILNFRGVREDLGTGYDRVEGNRRASRNGRVSVLPPEIPHVTIRNFCIAVLTSAPGHTASTRCDTAVETIRLTLA
jgi:hypothetical protein